MHTEDMPVNYFKLIKNKVVKQQRNDLEEKVMLLKLEKIKKFSPCFKTATILLLHGLLCSSYGTVVRDFESEAKTR